MPENGLLQNLTITLAHNTAKGWKPGTWEMNVGVLQYNLSKGRNASETALIRCIPHIPEKGHSIKAGVIGYLNDITISLKSLNNDNSIHWKFNADQITYRYLSSGCVEFRMMTSDGLPPIENTSTEPVSIDENKMSLLRVFDEEPPKSQASKSTSASRPEKKVVTPATPESPKSVKKVKTTSKVTTPANAERARNSEGPIAAGSKQCNVEGCTTLARAAKEVAADEYGAAGRRCLKHGGGKRCAVEGCTRVYQTVRNEVDEYGPPGARCKKHAANAA